MRECEFGGLLTMVITTFSLHFPIFLSQNRTNITAECHNHALSLKLNI